MPDTEDEAHKPHELLPIPDGELAKPLDTQALIMSAIEHGGNVEIIERLTAVAERIADRAAVAAWHRAMHNFHRDCPAIAKKGQIKDREGRVVIRYAKLEHMLGIVRPTLSRYGLHASWKYDTSETGSVGVKCIVRHDQGYSEDSGEIKIPIPQPTKMVNASQAIGVARAYGQRYSLEAVLGLQTDESCNDPTPPKKGGKATENIDADLRGDPPVPKTKTKKDHDLFQGDKFATVEQIGQIRKFGGKLKLDGSDWEKLRTKYDVSDLRELTEEQADKIIVRMTAAIPDEPEENINPDDY